MIPKALCRLINLFLKLLPVGDSNFIVRIFMRNKMFQLLSQHGNNHTKPPRTSLEDVRQFDALFIYVEAIKDLGEQ